jgi:hypothetical protein
MMDYELPRKHLRDIPDHPVLQFLEMLDQGMITSVYNTGQGIQIQHPKTACAFEGFANSIFNPLPYGGSYPKKLLWTKVKSMVKRGLIDGCTCGCRGDFELTEKGRASLEEWRASLTPRDNPKHSPQP